MTHRHMTEFMGLDFEMTIHEHYFEVLEVIERLFTYLFDGLHKRWGTLHPTSSLRAFCFHLQLSSTQQSLSDRLTNFKVFKSSTNNLGIRRSKRK